MLLWLPLGLAALCVGDAVVARIEDPASLRPGDRFVLAAWIGVIVSQWLALVLALLGPADPQRVFRSPRSRPCSSSLPPDSSAPGFIRMTIPAATTPAIRCHATRPSRSPVPQARIARTEWLMITMF